MKEVKIYNNLARKKEKFEPIEDGKVKFYSCGPTTYDFLHVGNARALVVGDLINRVLKSLGYNVTFVRNFTDVDDKIIARAAENNMDPLEHSAKYVEECKKDMVSLRMISADHTPKVSDTIIEIISMIERLVEKDMAYEVNGEVFFHVKNFDDYGKLSKKDLDSLQHGIRVEVDSSKKHPSDFVLWKPAKDGEPYWKSPWGKGRPGWHIECSAMAKKYLGDQIDIHHGGIDLMFPHHENEIAQSEAANGCSFSKYWCHNEFLNFGSEKMSKSLGNVITIRNFVETYSGEILRHLLCSVHYRSKMEWTDDAIDRAISDVERIHNFVVNFNSAKEINYDESGSSNFSSEISEFVGKMKEEISNDFNVPGMTSHLFYMIRLVNREFLDENNNFSKKLKLTPDVIDGVEKVLKFASESTGLVHSDAEDVLKRVKLAKKNHSNAGGKDSISDEDIDELVKQRKEARTTKNWALADEIRDKLNEARVVVKDNPDGTASWSYK